MKYRPIYSYLYVCVYMQKDVVHFLQDADHNIWRIRNQSWTSGKHCPSTYLRLSAEHQ